ncbi:MAG TPA: hypothetical protein VJ622_07315 [Acidimicrobiia bacterium]|nr:hypothetical protein [Acidimicrobiia bacterium]
MTSMPGGVFVNPAAGSELSGAELRELFPGHRVVECPGEEISERVAAAIAERPDFVAVAGGDGTLRGARPNGSSAPAYRCCPSPVAPATTSLWRSVGDGVLDVRLVLADRPPARTRVVLALLRGLDTSPLIVRETATDSVEVALDGEVERVETPSRYSVRRGELAVLVPPDADADVDPA